MAGASVIGALRIVLGADSAALDKGLKDAQSSLSSFGNFTRGVMEGLAASLAGAFAGMAVSIKSAIETADKMNKISQSTGVAVEELSKLKFAADLSDISMESLGKSLGKLSKALVAAGTDSASAAGRAFAAMGVDVKNQDGTLRNQSDVLKDIAEKFAGYKDGAEKTALSMQLFGKAGAAMIPLLNQGKDGLNELGDEAQKFGLVLDKQTTMAAEAFNDNLKKMDAIKQGLWTTIAARLLPALEQLSIEFLNAKKNSDFTSTAADLVTTAIRVLGAEVAITTMQFHNAGTELIAFKNLLTETSNSTDFGAAAWSKYSAVLENNEKNLSGLKSSLGTLSQNLDSDSFVSRFSTMTAAITGTVKETKRLQEEAKKTTAPGIGDTTEQKNALQVFLDTQAKRIAAQNAEAETVGKSVGAQAQLKLAYEANAIALAKGIPLNAANNLLIQQAGDAAALAAMKVAGANATLQAQSPAQQFQMQMDQLRQLYDAGVISLETFGARQKQIAEAAAATWDIAGASIAGSFATIAKSFGKEGSAMAKAAQVFGVIQGTISMFTGAAKALELPFPANIAAVAAVLAKGATLVAQIKSQTIPTGMMTGGSMMVKGSGGPDSVPVSMMASPGEQIDVWRPDQGGGQDPRRGAGGGTTVNLSMPIATTRDALRGIIDGLNDMFRDGYKLNVVPS